VVVVLSIELTDELKAEGLARDFVHLVQTARKEEQLDYQARIRLQIRADGPVAQAIQKFNDYIKSETLAVEIALDGNQTAKHQGEIDGSPVSFSLEIVK
jgi:isoleucyl-tRNA synthetase